MACGADFAVPDGRGRRALHEVARHGARAMEFGKFCLAHLQEKSAETRSRILHSVSAIPSADSRTTLAMAVVYYHAWYMLPQLVQLGMDVHWTPDKKQLGQLLGGAVRAATTLHCTALGSESNLFHNHVANCMKLCSALLDCRRCGILILLMSRTLRS